MKKIFLSIIVFATIFYGAQDQSGTSSSDQSGTSSQAKTSKSPMLDFFNSLDWDLFADKFEITLEPCTCDSSNGSIPMGVKASLVEPILGFSSSNDSMNFVGLGVKTGGDLFEKHGTSRDSAKSDTTGFRQSNFVAFPFMTTVGLVIPDLVCFDRTSEIRATYLSDVDPTYQNDILSMAVNPTRSLLINPLADLACLADCASATAGFPINSLYWCDGCRGNMGGGNTGYTKIGDPIENSEMIALRQMSVMHESFRLLKTSNATFSFLKTENPSSMCKDQIFPMLIKSQYYIQLAYGSAKRFGAMRFHYNFKSTPIDGDDFFFWIWRVRDYCFGQTQCK